ncbi:MAG: serine/threonine protein kinase, partial [Candidatus Dormibacteraeota bacterium]|nr:serine/threonine protein kinase [Candidatus Dormibacteraeota bacterium]
MAHDAALDRDVALKELSPALAGDPAFLERFRAEARVMATLDHPNCVKVFDFFEEEGRAVLVSEYIRGASLRQVADHQGHLTPEQALGVLKGALRGLAYAHGRGLVHRDIKPDNLLADVEGVSKLADFGQSLMSSGPGAAGGMPAGTPAYMSPEMVAGGKVDLRTDIYSLGAVLFEFLTGRAPYTGDSPLAVMRKHTNDPVPDPRSLNSDLPAEVGALVSRAMAKKPTQRQRTAEQFLDELEAAAVAAYGEDWEKRSSIKRLVAATAAALGLLLVGAAGAAASSAAAVGEATVGGFNRWLIAGGAAALLVL